MKGYLRTKNGKDDKEIGTRVFNNIDVASSFWRELWEKPGEGNENAEWLQEITAAIANKVPRPDESSHYVHGETIRNEMRRKKNWSAPGPDRIVNFWWKMTMTSLRHSKPSREAWRPFNCGFWEGKSTLIRGFPPLDETAMLVYKTIENSAHVLHKNRVKFPKGI